MDGALCDLLVAVLHVFEASGVLAYQIETRMLLLLGVTAQHLATTSFRLFPSPEVTGFIGDGLSAYYQEEALSPTEMHSPAIILLATMIPYYTQRGRQPDSRGPLSSVLAPLVDLHWSIAYLIAVMRTWMFGSGLFYAIYQLAAGRSATFYGLFILNFVFGS